MITGTWAALLALLYLALSVLVIRQRYRSRTAIGLGTAEGLLRASRAHGNFAEYVPLALVLMLLLEQGGAPAFLLHGLGAALLLGRASHAWGISRSPERLRFRQLGMLATFGVLAVAALALLLR
ncbi:MAPEG family protein [Roseococcus sp. DSY-14]|uniref:MAPEG family protein n=1 Tax=Roseococcus sp. DSY-14 TaxID=3369650 RepID=UPI00387AE73A